MIKPDDTDALLLALRQPFAAEEIDWFPGQTAKDGGSGHALAYITARRVYERLDAVMGGRWRSRFEELRLRTGPAEEAPRGREEQGGRRAVKRSPSIIIAVLGLYLKGPDGVWNWVERSDGSGDSAIEPEKGALSGAIKRAASAGWGIGRELYAYPRVPVRMNGKYIDRAEYPRLLIAARKAREAYLSNPTMSDPDPPPELPEARTPAPMAAALASPPSPAPTSDEAMQRVLAAIKAGTSWDAIEQAVIGGRAELERLGRRSAAPLIEQAYAARVVASLLQLQDPDAREDLLRRARDLRLTCPTAQTQIRAAKQGMVP